MTILTSELVNCMIYKLYHNIAVFKKEQKSGSLLNERNLHFPPDLSEDLAKMYCNTLSEYKGFE